MITIDIYYNHAIKYSNKHTNNITYKRTKIMHRSFMQSYCRASTLNLMRPEKISQHEMLLKLIASDYAICEPLVNTKADVLLQKLLIDDSGDGTIDSGNSACSLTYLD